MTRRHLAVLIALFALTRVLGAWFADSPERYAPSTFGAIVGDVTIYEAWAGTLLRDDVAAYSGVGIEYPPGSLPFVTAPQLVGELLGGQVPYRRAFVSLMVLVDVAGFAGLLLLARRWGSPLGLWAWTVLLPLLGPIMYLRLDLVPAVATIWAVAAAARGSWFGAGAWAGFGAVAKIYPVFLLPAIMVVSRRRRDVVLGASVLVAAALLPFTPYLDDVGRSVGLYHAERGIQLESLWASLLLLAGRFGHDVEVVFNYGAAHVESSAVAVLEPVALMCSLAVVGAGTWVAWTRVPRGDARTLAAVLFATLAGLLALGTVFSPQFLIWLVALAGCALAVPRSPSVQPAAMLVPIVAFTHLIFPFRYGWLMVQRVDMVAVLVARNLLVVALALSAFVLLARLPRVAADTDSDAAALRRETVQ